MFRRLFRLFLYQSWMIGAIALAACSGGSFFSDKLDGKSSTSNFVKVATPTGSKTHNQKFESIQDYKKYLDQQRLQPGFFEDLKNTQISDLFDVSEMLTDLDSEIFGHKFSMKSERIKADREAILSKYSTVGEMLEEIGIYSAEDYNFDYFENSILTSTDTSEVQTETNSPDHLSLLKNTMKPPQSDNGGGSVSPDWKKHEEEANQVTYDHERNISCRHSNEDESKYDDWCRQCQIMMTNSGQIKPWSSLREGDRLCHSCAAADHAEAARSRRGCVNQWIPQAWLPK